MAAPKKFSDELRERATRMAIELRADPETRSSAIPRGCPAAGDVPGDATELGPPAGG